MFFAPTLRTTRFVPRSYDRAFERFVNDAFTGARRTIATLALRRAGFDPSAASNGLIGLSNALPTYGMERLRWRERKGCGEPCTQVRRQARTASVRRWNC